MIEDSLSDWSAAEGAYDAIADRYDAVPVGNRINAYMRRESSEKLRSLFGPGMRVLEIGCGTGDEAIGLARRGVRIVGIDSSKEMVRLAQRKVEAAGLSRLVTLLVSRARDLGQLGDRARGPFDGGYASFSLAYEPDLGPVATALDALLVQGATFLASLPSRVCLVELFVAALLLRPGLAGRRLRPFHGHKVGLHRVPIRTYAPAALARAFSPHFVMERLESLPALVPPPYMIPGYSKLNPLAPGIEWLDSLLRSRWPFRSLGDHLMAQLRHI